LHLQGALMRAVPSAAGREIRAGAGREGEQRRDQRKAEEEKKRDAEKTSHSVIVAELWGLLAGWL
jgi:ribosomal protein L12E/L44/L45/RPP1/RPP2